MATCWNPTVLCINNTSPKINSNLNYCPTFSASLKLENGVKGRQRRFTKLHAGLSAVEPDINEDPIDRWATNGVAPEDFEYGIYDGHHTYFETSEKGSFWGAVADEYNSMEPPTGFQGIMSWLFLPAIAAGMYYNVPGEYLYIGAGVFVVIFCTFEILKPDQPHNFEPQIYNMERKARDKLISEYNTMDIWDFNEKYGDLWDFTVKHDDVLER
ncbi:hypothetical protein KSS87_007652 [Heliosperma pusillum]|nr:hypothetical protein KSS87_007652 [Heliosperma pusillum]